MTNKKIKRMLDACYQAKRIREMLPPLPEGIMSSHIRYMDMIQELQKQNDHVKVSDLSDVLNIPRPGVTRTIKEMEKKGLVQKISSPDDGRVTYLSLTDHGKEISEKYNIDYLFSDFKKKNGYQRSVELSHEYGMYRQDYCGCVFSMRERERVRKEQTER